MQGHIFARSEELNTLGLGRVAPWVRGQLESKKTNGSGYQLPPHNRHFHKFPNEVPVFKMQDGVAGSGRHFSFFAA